MLLLTYCIGKGFGSCFDYVKSRRKVCSPNTAFTCHLLELAELLAKDNVVVGNLMFRCAYHLPHDATTPCLKLCRNNETRKIIKPILSLFSPNAVYVIRVVWGDGSHQEVVSDHPNSVYAFEAETIYIWSGTSSTPSTTTHAMVLAKYMHGVFTTTENIQLINQGSEPREFLEALKIDESEQPLDSGHNSMVATAVRWVEDYFDFPPSQEEIQLSCSRVAADRSNTFFDEGRKRSSASKSVEGDQRREREPHARPHEESPLIKEDVDDADPCTSLRPPRMPSIRMNSNNSTDDSLRYSRTNSISFSIIADSSTPSSVQSSRKNSNYNVSSAAADGDKTIIAVAPNHSEPIPRDAFVEESVLTSCDSAVLIIEAPSLVIAPIALQSAHIKSLRDFDNSTDNYYISPESSACSSSLPHYPCKRRFSREDNDDPDDNIQADTTVTTSVAKGSSVADAELDASTEGEAMDALPVKGIAMDAIPVKGIAMDADIDVDMSPTKGIAIHSSPVGVDITPPTLTKTGSDNSIRPSSAVSRPSSGASKQSSGIFGNRSNKVAPLNMSSLDAAALCPSDNNTGRSSISSSNIATDRTNTGMDGSNDKSSSSRSGNNSSKGGGIVGLLKIPGRSLSPVLSLVGLSGTSSATKLNTTQHMNLQQQPTQDHSHSINIGGGSSSSLTLPLPERRGTPVEREKHPENVSLSRAPTPVEDLTPVKVILEVGSGSDGILSPSEVVPTSCIRSSSSQYLPVPASTISAAESFSKPLLFQAIPCRKSRLFDVESELSKKLSAAVELYEWQAMGVYDDEDLDKVMQHHTPAKQVALRIEGILGDLMNE